MFAFTSCDSKNYDCLQTPVRKVLAFILCRLTDVRHAPSEPPAKRTLADGDRRERVRSAAAARRDPAVHDGHGRRSRQKKSSLSIISYEKASQVFEEKELSAVRSCQAGGSGKGSGVDDWLCMNGGCSSTYLVHVYIGMPIKLFFVRNSGGGGESKQILREYGFKKTSKITDDPLGYGKKIPSFSSSHAPILAPAPIFLFFFFNDLFWQKRHAIEKKKGGSRAFSGFSKSGQITHDQSVSFLHIVSWSLCRRPCGSRAQLRALTFLTAQVDSELERLVSLLELELLEDDGDGFDVGVPAEILFLSAN